MRFPNRTDLECLNNYGIHYNSSVGGISESRYLVQTGREPRTMVKSKNKWTFAHPVGAVSNRTSLERLNNSGIHYRLL